MSYTMPYRVQDSNKGTFGKVLNFAGSKNYIGAAYLSTFAVMKVGAGYCALSSEKNVIRSVSTLLPEAVFLTQSDGIKRIKDFSVVLVGCGLGKNLKLLKKVISQTPSITPIIIDADGLNLLASLNNDILNNLPKDVVITPHPIEAARLLKITPDAVLRDLEGAAKQLCHKYNCVTVLKTHRTIICKGEDVYINAHGNSALAKAGSGDVLSGIISGLVAQKMDIFEAAKLGVYLHSSSGELASQELTEYSVLASEILKYLPKAINEII